MSDSDKTITNETPAAEENTDLSFGEGKHALVLEDEPTSAQLIKSILSECNFTVLQATNGKEALDKIRATAKPDIIISDFLMPEMNGFQFLKELKASPDMQNIPVVFLSERKNMEDSLIVSGIDAFFPKPLDTAEFIKTIRTLAARKSDKNIPEKSEQ